MRTIFQLLLFLEFRLVCEFDIYKYNILGKFAAMESDNILFCHSSHGSLVMISSLTFPPPSLKSSPAPLVDASLLLALLVVSLSYHITVCLHHALNFEVDHCVYHYWSVFVITIKISFQVRAFNIGNSQLFRSSFWVCALSTTTISLS